MTNKIEIIEKVHIRCNMSHFYFILGKTYVYKFNNISRKPFPVVNYGSCTLAVNFHCISDKDTNYWSLFVSKPW